MEEGKIRVGKGEGEGKGKEKQEQAAFLPPCLERTASGENQNTPLPLVRGGQLGMKREFCTWFLQRHAHNVHVAETDIRQGK